MVEAFVCDAVRTPIGRYGGALSTVRPDDLAAVPLSALLARNPGLDPAAIEELVLGCANQAGEDNRNVARMSLLLAGYPVSVPGSTINRLCGSGMDAVSFIARSIRAGEIDIGVGGGVESMSRAPFVVPKAGTAFSRSSSIEDTTIGWRLVNKLMKERYGIDSMPQTADNVAAQFEIGRADQDAFALRSQQRWKAAFDAGVFDDEIVGVDVPRKKGVVDRVTADEHPRPDTTLDALARLKGINGPELSVTAGNASGVNDGACALLIASEAAAARNGLTPRARIVATATAGVDPRIMGIGPLPATQKLLAKTGLRIDQVDLIELNEAFASQALATLRGLGLADDAAHVNPNGGAIALGHPLGMSGARLVTTATWQLQRSGGRYAVCTMCIGVGQGIALLLERV
ncbi:3-oxoadipyl-CoA thiolase [Parazoarcus communis]|uniref:3-oxoadipyl-CoA thiolase n=1 Tax=Parazoarcus communis TaxID=41977 RepID=A0A2U8H6P2_9RHOO|nr:3-oxoadipyl-CoA thiolase [Parazoarcus communis]AWI80846.1 3-oxoadipyl-CoA thiolase [Parazoarcus communis]